MPRIRYTDVKGPLPRYWIVRDVTNRNLDLKDGDYLLFDGDTAGTITRLRPKEQPGDPRNLPVQWAHTCNLDPDAGRITGTHKGGEALTIDFTPASGTRSASHFGDIPTLPEDSTEAILSGGTWMADEGP